MRKLVTLTVAALLWGTATFASGYSDTIERAYETAGYSEVHVTRSHGDWMVSARMNSKAVRFVVNPATGISTPVSDDGVNHDAGDDHGQDGASHDAGDDHGSDGAGHDAGDDHGSDGAGHDAGDDHGHDGAGHDAGDDHGNDGAGHDAGDDHGRHRGGHHG